MAKCTLEKGLSIHPTYENLEGKNVDRSTCLDITTENLCLSSYPTYIGFSSNVLFRKHLVIRTSPSATYLRSVRFVLPPTQPAEVRGPESYIPQVC